MPVDHARNHNGWDGDPVGHFRHHRRCGAQCRRGHFGPCVPVDDDGCDQVHGYVGALEEVEGPRVVARGVELGDEGEEGDVACRGGNG